MSRHADLNETPALQDSIRPLAAPEFDQIRHLARQSFGLDLKAGKEELVSARLRRLVRQGGFGGFQEYLRHVETDSSGDALRHMIDALATNHTSFLREPDHFDFLRHAVLPGLAERELVEIWCAGCSTGEEAWTLAFVLNDALAGRFQIVATDISNRALRTAERAEYAVENCRGLPASWLRQHFVPAGDSAGKIRICPRIRNQVSFRRINLIAPLGPGRQFPVIFCRNVMIYFDRATQERVVDQMAERLAPGGYLFVGHAESLTRVHHSLEYVRPAVYRKAEGRGATWNRS